MIIIKVVLNGHIFLSDNEVVNNSVPQFSYQDMKNYGWFGGSLDNQPYTRDDRQVTGVRSQFFLCFTTWHLDKRNS